jgi:prophage DNA circulation protein
VDETTTTSSRRIGPEDRPFGAGTAGLFRPLPRRALALRIMAVPFAWPLLLALVRGAAVDFVAVGGGMALLLVAARLIDQGLVAEQQGVLASPRVLPPKLAGALAAAAAAFLISAGATNDGALMSVVMAALAFAGAALSYGLDGRLDRKTFLEAARKAGVRPDEVVGAIDEARRKVADIEAAAARLHSRELKARVARIAQEAREVLAQVERKPGDIGRARRFLATYLDGTRDVVRRFAEQQKDLADTPLAENFRRVLTTIEQVFGEQRELLRRDDKLDLEVKIEVLETQMRREGVH